MNEIKININNIEYKINTIYYQHTIKLFLEKLEEIAKKNLIYKNIIIENKIEVFNFINGRGKSRNAKIYNSDYIFYSYLLRYKNKDEEKIILNDIENQLNQLKIIFSNNNIFFEYSINNSDSFLLDYYSILIFLINKKLNINNTTYNEKIYKTEFKNYFSDEISYIINYFFNQIKKFDKNLINNNLLHIYSCFINDKNYIDKKILNLKDTLNYLSEQGLYNKGFPFQFKENTSGINFSDDFLYKLIKEIEKEKNNKIIGYNFLNLEEKFHNLTNNYSEFIKEEYLNLFIICYFLNSNNSDYPIVINCNKNNYDNTTLQHHNSSRLTDESFFFYSKKRINQNNSNYRPENTYMLSNKHSDFYTQKYDKSYILYSSDLINYNLYDNSEYIIKIKNGLYLLYIDSSKNKEKKKIYNLNFKDKNHLNIYLDNETDLKYYLFFKDNTNIKKYNTYNNEENLNYIFFDDIFEYFKVQELNYYKSSLNLKSEYFSNINLNNNIELIKKQTVQNDSINQHFYQLLNSQYFFKNIIQNKDNYSIYDLFCFQQNKINYQDFKKFELKLSMLIQEYFEDIYHDIKLIQEFSYNIYIYCIFSNTNINTFNFDVSTIEEIKKYFINFTIFYKMKQIESMDFICSQFNIFKLYMYFNNIEKFIQFIIYSKGLKYIEQIKQKCKQEKNKNNDINTYLKDLKNLKYLIKEEIKKFLISSLPENNLNEIEDLDINNFENYFNQLKNQNINIEDFINQYNNDNQILYHFNINDKITSKRDNCNSIINGSNNIKLNILYPLIDLLNKENNNLNFLFKYMNIQKENMDNFSSTLPFQYIKSFNSFLFAIGYDRVNKLFIFLEGYFSYICSFIINEVSFKHLINYDNNDNSGITFGAWNYIIENINYYDIIDITNLTKNTIEKIKEISKTIRNFRNDIRGHGSYYDIHHLSAFELEKYFFQNLDILIQINQSLNIKELSNNNNINHFIFYEKEDFILTIKSFNKKNTFNKIDFHNYSNPEIKEKQNVNIGEYLHKLRMPDICQHFLDKINEYYDIKNSNIKLYFKLNISEYFEYLSDQICFKLKCEYENFIHCPQFINFLKNINVNILEGEDKNFLLVYNFENNFSIFEEKNSEEIKLKINTIVNYIESYKSFIDSYD